MDHSHLPPSLSELATRNRRRRMLRNVATVSISLGVLLLAGLVMTDSLRPRGAEPSLAQEPAGRAGTDPVTVQARARDAGEQIRRLRQDRSQRPLTHEAPLRLLVAGDSISGGLGLTLGDLTSDTGIINQYVDYRVGSGLFSGDRDWLERARQDVDEFAPEATVFMIGTNDAVVDDRFSDEEYAASVGALMDVFIGDGGHTVYWIGAPTLENPDWDEAAQRVNAIMRAQAERRPEVVYVDAYRLFEGPDGGFGDVIEDLDGTSRRMRAGDGVHLTNAGNQYFARTVFGLLDAQWDIVAQAVEGRPIGFTTAPGGGTAPGVSSRGSTGGSSGGGTGVTTPPATSSSTTPATTTTVATTSTTTPTTVATTSTTVATTTSSVETTTTTTAPPPPP